MCIMSSVTCLARPHFSILFHKGHNFSKSFIERKVRVLLFSTTSSKTFLTLRIIQRDSIRVHTSAYKVPNIPSGFNETCTICTDFRKFLKCQIPWKCSQWESSYSMRKDKRTGGQTDMTKLILSFHILRTRLKVPGLSIIQVYYRFPDFY
jgi:hypothetical protein